MSVAWGPTSSLPIPASISFTATPKRRQPPHRSIGLSNDAIAASLDSKDKFIFKSLLDLQKKIKTTDIIADWDKKDVINISHMNKAKFDFIGKSHFNGDGDPEVRFQKFKAKDYTAVYIDKNGDGHTDASIKVLGLHGFHDNDFVL